MTTHFSSRRIWLKFWASTTIRNIITLEVTPRTTFKTNSLVIIWHTEVEVSLSAIPWRRHCRKCRTTVCIVTLGCLEVMIGWKLAWVSLVFRWQRREAFTRSVFFPLWHTCSDVRCVCTFLYHVARVEGKLVWLSVVFPISHPFNSSRCSEDYFILRFPEHFLTFGASSLHESA